MANRLPERAPDTAELAADVARLYELVCDLGEAVTGLTAELAALKARRQRGEDPVAAALRAAITRDGAR